MRFDVPTIGVGTVKTIHESGGTVLAIEAEKTIMLEQHETVSTANRLGVKIIALSDAQVRSIAA